MSSPDADERGTRDYNNRIDQCTWHFDFSFVVTSAALAKPSRNGEDRTSRRVGLHPARFAGYFLNIDRGEPPSPSHPSGFSRTFASPPSHLRVIPRRGNTRCVKNIVILSEGAAVAEGPAVHCSGAPSIAVSSRWVGRKERLVILSEGVAVAEGPAVASRNPPDPSPLLAVILAQPESPYLSFLFVIPQRSGGIRFRPRSSFWALSEVEGLRISVSVFVIPATQIQRGFSPGSLALPLR